MARVYLDPESWGGGGLGFYDPPAWEENVSPVTASDTLSPTVTESRAVQNAFSSAGDTLVPTVADSGRTPFVVFDAFTRTDTLTPTVADSGRTPTAVGEEPKSGSDTLAPTITEAPNAPRLIYLELSSSDTLYPTVGEAANVSPVSTTITYLDAQSWSVLTGYTDSASWEAVLPAYVTASDTLATTIAETNLVTRLASSTDDLVPTITSTSQPLVKIGVTLKVSTDDLVPTITSAATTPVAIDEITATDDLTVEFEETRTLLGGSTFRIASDTLTVDAVEQPLAARTIRSGDTLTPTIIDTTPFGLILKSGSDTLTVEFEEQFQINAFGASYPTASDTLTPTVTATAKSLIRAITVSASDTLTIDVSEASAIVASYVKLASDALTPMFDDVPRPLIIFLPPAPGELPEGWYSVEESELAGITTGWLYNPENITPVQGWYFRTFWSVYDNHAQRIITDGVRTAAHQQAMSIYQSRGPLQ